MGLGFETSPLLLLMGKRFSPASLPGLHSYWDARFLNSITKDGSDKVSEWANQVDGAPNFVQTGSATLQPTYKTVAGHPCLEFDEDPIMTAGSAGDFNFLHDGTGGTMFMVVRLDSTSTNDDNSMAGNSIPNASGIGFSLLYDLSGTEIDYATRNGTDGTVTIGDTGGTLNKDVVIACYFDVLDRAGANNNVLAYYNNDLGTTVEQNALNSANSDFELTLGSLTPTAGFQRLYGQVYAIVIYDRVLTDSERAQLFQWAYDNWGITP